MVQELARELVQQVVLDQDFVQDLLASQDPVLLH